MRICLFVYSDYMQIYSNSKYFKTNQNGLFTDYTGALVDPISATTVIVVYVHYFII